MIQVRPKRADAARIWSARRRRLADGRRRRAVWFAPGRIFAIARRVGGDEPRPFATARRAAWRRQQGIIP